MVSMCSRVILLNNVVESTSSSPCPPYSGSSFVRISPFSPGLVRCKGSSAVTRLPKLGASLSYGSSTAFCHSIPFSNRSSKFPLHEISSTGMAIQVEVDDQQVQSGAPSTEAEHPWILDISIPREVLAGYKEDYEAEAKTWPADLGNTSDFKKLEEFVISAHMLARKWLPRDIVRRLEKFSHDPSQPSALIIRGLPIDEDLPPTTTEGLKLKIGKYMSESWLMGISRIIGQPFNLRMSLRPTYQNGMGMIFKDILPCPSDHEAVSQYGSSALLNLHCDYFQGVQECWVHTIAFIGIRGDPQKVGRTLLADFREIYNRTSAADIKTLREQRLTWRFGPNPENWFTQYGILGSGDNPQLYLFDEFVGGFAFDRLIQGSPEALAAYKRMKDVALDCSLQHGGVRLEGGDVLLLNQRRVAHGRNSFEAKYDGNDRWLQKVYVNEGQIWQPHGLVPWPERLLPDTRFKGVTAN